MATTEYLNARINKAQENIEKKKGTIERKTKLIKKKTTYLLEKYNIPTLKDFDRYNKNGWTNEEHNDIYWTICDIENLENDIKSLTNKINEYIKSLNKYKCQLKAIIDKEKSRNITVILNFLETWKKNNYNFYIEQKDRYDKALIEHTMFVRDKNAELDALPYQASWNEDNEYYSTYKKISKELSAERTKFRDSWMHVTQFIRTDKAFEEMLEIELEREKNRKYDDLIERTNKIVGQITDASSLTVDGRGNLNGYVQGTKGKASVTTIGAGGYNIQCFHFRTLIHEI